MNRATVKIRLAIAIVVASVAFVLFLIITGTTINGFTLWG
jgi:hypothetical protein